MARDWRERDHPRNPHTGEFVEKTGGVAWAQRIAGEIGRRIGREPITPANPPGHGWDLGEADPDTGIPFDDPSVTGRRGLQGLQPSGASWRGKPITPANPPGHGWDLGEMDPDTGLPFDDPSVQRVQMERLGNRFSSTPRATKVDEAAKAVRDPSFDYNGIVSYLDDAALSSRELDEVGQRMGINVTGHRRDEDKARAIADHVSSDILQGLRPVGGTDMPDGYEFDAGWAATNRGALMSGRYEVFIGDDWDIPQMIIRLPQGVVRVIGHNGGVLMRPGDIGNVRRVESDAPLDPEIAEFWRSRRPQ